MKSIPSHPIPSRIIRLFRDQLGEGGPLLKLWVEGVSVGYPGKRNEESASSKLTPRECRERGLTYHGGLLVDLCYQVRCGAG